MPQQSIVIHDQAILYMSENISDETKLVTIMRGGDGSLISYVMNTMRQLTTSSLIILNSALSMVLG